jgi:hypothetical protein
VIYNARGRSLGFGESAFALSLTRRNLASHERECDAAVADTICSFRVGCVQQFLEQFGHTRLLLIPNLDAAL